MGTPTAQESHKFKSILQDFSEASRTTTNLDKYRIFFFNTPEAIQIHISRLLGIPQSSLLSKYLGIPLLGSMDRNISWEPLLQSLTNWLSSWTFRSLNLACCLVLLKYVLQVIAIYLFFALADPQKVLQAIKTLQRRFLWKGHNSNSKWTLVSWDNICKPKLKGNLRLRDPYTLNEIMGAKIWWRWLKNQKEL